MHPQFFNVGYWDDSGNLAELKIELNGAPWISKTDSSELTNSIYRVPINGASLQPHLRARVAILAKDAAGNTQRYEKTVYELVKECVAAGGQLPAKPRRATPTQRSGVATCATLIPS